MIILSHFTEEEQDEFGAKFKLIGAPYLKKGQEALSKLCGVRDQVDFSKAFGVDEEFKPQLQESSFFAKDISYKVELHKEPTNPADPNAIVVKLSLENGNLVPIGYIVSELTKHVHPYLENLHAFITSIRYRAKFSNEGYYGIIFLVKKGPWPKKVRSASYGVS